VKQNEDFFVFAFLNLSKSPHCYDGTQETWRAINNSFLGTLSGDYQPPPLPQPLGPASARLPSMYQQQPQTSAGLQPTLMAALNACQHAAASSPRAQWPQNLQQAGLPPKHGRKPPGSKGQMIRTVVFKRGKDGLQGKSLAESCKSFDTCFLFQRDMAKNGLTSISRVCAGACMSPNEP
jgi:hypothetical protein